MSEPAERPGLHAHASGDGRVYQAGRDQHFHYQDGVRRRRRARAGEVADECPYPGLAAFGPGQARWFFGRDGLLATLTARLDDHARRGGLLMVVAPSGAGKSSLLRAGLVPALEDGALPGSRHRPCRLLTPTADPVAVLTAHLAAAAGVAAPEMAEATAGGPEPTAAALRAATRVEGSGDGPRLVLVIDQFEELFTQCADESERRRFVDLISGLADADTAGEPPAALVVCGLRSDFYTPCADHPRLRAALQDGQVLVGPMTRDELTEAIRFPAQDVGLEVEPGLVELLLRDLGADEHRGYEAGRLPLLAHALRTTWQQRHGHVLAVDGYRATGGIHQAVATTAEQIFNRLDEDGRRIAPLLFPRLLIIGDGTEDVRRRVARAELLGEGPDSAARRALVDAFTRGRLLTQDQDTVEITHEALLRAWPRLRAWIDDDRAGLLVRQHLLDAARQWHRDGRDPAGLYRGSRLAVAREWAGRDTAADRLDPLAREFLQAAILLEDGERRALARRNRRLRVVTAALATLLAVAAVTAGLAVDQRRNAAANARVATSRELAARSSLADRPEAAMLLAAAAHRQADTTEARSALLSAGTQGFAGELRGAEYAITSIAYSPDGRAIAAASADIAGADQNQVRPAHGSLIRWDAAGGGRPVHVPLARRIPLGVAFSPDGRLLASVEGDSGRTVVTLRDPSTLAPITELDDGPTSKGAVVPHLAFSRDGRVLAASGDHAVRMWDAATHERLATISTGRAGPTAFDLAPDGRHFVTGGTDGTIRLWDARTRKAATLPGRGWNLADVRYSPDGRAIATADKVHPVVLWDTAARRALRPLTGLPGPGAAVAFSGDGAMLATDTNDGKVQLWDTATGLPLAQLTGHQGGLNTVAFQPQGHTLASAGMDQTVRLWSLDRSVLTVHPSNSVNSVAYSPDGRTLAAGTDGTVRLWDTATGRMTPIPAPAGPANAIAFSPSGSVLAAGAGQNVLLWDTAHRRPITRLPARPGLPVQGLAFSPDGRTLATVSGDAGAAGALGGRLQLWDVGSGRNLAALAPPGMDRGQVGGTLLTVAFSPDGRTLATGDASGFVRFWDVAARRVVDEFWNGAAGSVLALAFSPDGRTLATGGQNQIVRLWDARTHRRIAELTGHTGIVWRLAFDRDGTSLATAGFDGSVRLWDVAARRLTAVLTSPSPSILGTPPQVFAVGFSPDGGTVAAGRANGTILRWDVDPSRVAARICREIRQSYRPDELPRIAPELADRRPCG
ncbi:WD40 repeat domain-containing protein [Actinomadura sp. WMMA1423]|uniref:NACHT and WD repeat domain-containing protein n=1 Tax=Actinomadura sp. WMMA1423 TaxID=2591108 RepID=UPI0011471763|nr:WD40 repeat domain-containing protein [Actinomadura sp. WMMA1423]